MADVIAAYPPWVIRAVVRLARSPAVERLLLDGPGRVMRPGGHADAFEEWLVERTLKAARSEEWQASTEYEYLRAEWERGR
ncbi:MAG: hypothetical protein V4502_03880 [Pseudomonadota bacterium]